MLIQVLHYVYTLHIYCEYWVKLADIRLWAAQVNLEAFSKLNWLLWWKLWRWNHISLVNKSAKPLMGGYQNVIWYFFIFWCLFSFLIPAKLLLTGRQLGQSKRPGRRIIDWLEVKGPSGPQLLVCGPSGLLDFVLRALRTLRPCDDDSIVHMYVRCMSKMGTNGRKAEF